jgi:hypothetical protein
MSVCAVANVQVFSSVLEIMPASGQSSAGIVPVDLPVAKSTSGFFSARFRRFTSSSSHGLPAATRAISATPPVVRRHTSPSHCVCGRACACVCVCGVTDVCGVSLCARASAAGL